LVSTKQDPETLAFRQKIQQAFVFNLKLLGYDPQTKDGQAIDPQGKNILPGSTLSRVHGGIGSVTPTSTKNAMDFGNKTRSRPVFGPDMFLRPNASGFYHAIYFLLSCLRKQYVTKTFEHCWPLFDNSQVREFRKIVLGEFKQLVEVGAIPAGLAVPSLITNPMGIRAERVLWLLSTYTLEKVMAKKYPESFAELNMPKPKTSKDFQTEEEYKCHLRELIAATHAHGAYRAQLFREQSAIVARSQDEWENYSVELTKAHRAASRQKVILKKKLNDVVSEAVNVEGEPVTLVEDNILAPGGLPDVQDVLSKPVLQSIGLDDVLNAPPLDGAAFAALRRASSPRSETVDLSAVLDQANAHIKELNEELVGHPLGEESFETVYEDAIPMLGGDRFADGLKATLKKYEELPLKVDVARMQLNEVTVIGEDPVDYSSIKSQLQNLRRNQGGMYGGDDVDGNRLKSVEATISSLRSGQNFAPTPTKVLVNDSATAAAQDGDFFSSPVGMPMAPSIAASPESPKPLQSVPTPEPKSARPISTTKKVHESTSLEQKRLLVKLLTNSPKRKVKPPSPLRTELIKLISALHKHGSITNETRGRLKDKVIFSKSVGDLQAAHKEITELFGDSIVPLM
jgi:hypothetical protein